MLANILKVEGVQVLNQKVLKQVNGGSGCSCGGGHNAPGGNESGNGEGGQCHEC
ncbi:hypothetical protein ATE84_1120 [Aquimarina sp. MAR_2010_214]|uniref:hypothetical protein n=1 Tax=Aquimarina sp. MAR_2010_214 TaxID=1250026 RepID=UPI000CC1DECE|nr:hypothetical protein [Aquimarina sp. MAR_2010_214]PKV49103.1 hypothetical protein ATE84_1120 [Aquimarina sp. MAR_2010_214]